MTARDWRERAACQGSDLELFFMDRDSDLEEPRRLCGMCPVRADCLAEALEIRDVEGFRAGLTGEERRQRLPKRSPRQLVNAAAVMHMHGLGWSSTAIGVAVGATPDLVQLIIRQRPQAQLVERMVGSFGVVRRRQALACVGYSLTEIATHMGVTAHSVNGNIQRSRIRLEVFERWRQVYDALVSVPGVNSRAMGVAARLGWAPPWAWPGDSIDDPDARPVLEQEAVA